jgi:asparagine synthase (glutamine-hydrolysing)
MCGITGAIWTDPAKGISREELDRMTDALAHRGPDDRGELHGEIHFQPPYEPLPGIALGFRRLSIIDLASGHQPMCNESKDVWIVFNGEIYNFAELRHRLEGAGHAFRTKSDTETIVHLYEDEGPGCFEHLNGMFAVAIWDASRRRLVLGRDRLGKKPLVYRHERGRLLFASELKSLLEAPIGPLDIDPGAVDEYLTYQYIPHPKTIYRGVHKLPPGCYAVFQDDRLEVNPYWRPDFSREQKWSEDEAIERLRELLDDAVRLRLQSDVPLGAFLSGGVDSSLVTALAQKHAGERLKTFSIGFPVAEYDETRYARRVAEHLDTEHHEFQVTPDAVQILPRQVRQYDEPFSDSSAVPTWYVSELTRRHVTVALSGDGGDELFAGYPRYKAAALAAAIDRLPLAPAILSARFWQLLPGAKQKSLLRKAKRFGEALGKRPARRYLDWVSIFDEGRRAELYNDDFLARLPNADPADFLDAAWRRTGKRDAVTAASLTDLVTYLPCDLMAKVDIASMAHGLECRQPFLDFRVVEFAAGLPSKLKYRRGKGKLLLRKAFGDLLPDEIWTRQKMGFGVPLDHWFRHELKPMTHETLLAGDALCREFFRPKAVAKLVNEHESMRFDHSYRLWSLLVFELWLRDFRSRQPAAPVQNSPIAVAAT